MAKHCRKISGDLQIGTGKKRELNHITVGNPYGDAESVDIQFSCDGHAVWLRVSADMAYTIAQAIMTAVKMEG